MNATFQSRNAFFFHTGKDDKISVSIAGQISVEIYGTHIEERASVEFNTHKT